MKYANGRPAQVNDLVLATPHSGSFLGRVTSLQGKAFQVVPVHSADALYIAPGDLLLADDAILPASEVKPYTA
jgi:hypothetical protein